ncbi:TonB-dependent receptor [Flavisolibacter ginsenosidimutans]|uniref:TonB-dependent receptor n=1 Tax=Flavisolibacter ginsenosidimutans TaxID=661481 RepID=A0A5B8ULB0_9BACT|nr:TonB-dependent receptor [Flavisolibacter ginsenosidimutans]QEC57491.1 TonB-dependent receptor [Flavisolibacter ginsenosidimutans]
MRLFFFLLLYFIQVNVLKAQTEISGQIKDNKNKPIPGASVTVKDSYDGGVADSTGRFKFITTEKGQKLLVVTAIGYKGFEQEINLDAPLQPFSFTMKEEPDELKAVVISAGTFEASDRKRAAAVLTSLDVVTTASANGDVTGALKTLPGAQQVGESEGLFVRGGAAAETKIFIDGTLVNKFFFQAGPNIAGYGRFNPFLFKGTVFSTGGYSALYGQALSSAVILESIDLPEQTSASLGLTVLSATAGYQQLNKKKTASWGINYDYTNLGLAFGLVKQKQDYFTVPAFHNIEGNFRIKTSASGMVKYYGNFSNNHLGFTTPSIDAPNYLDKFALKNTYQYHNLSWRERLGTYWRLAAGVSYTNNKDNINGALQDASKKDVTVNGLEFKNFAFDKRGHYVNTKVVFDRRLPGLSAIRFGSEYNFSDDPSVYTDYTNASYKTSLKQHTTALFAESDIYVTNNVAAKVGTRLEHSSYLDKTNIAPRLSLAYKLGKESQASLAYGIFYQNPETQYLPAVSPLDFSKATHYIAQYQKTTSLQVFRVEGFYKKYEQLLKTGTLYNREGQALSSNGFGDAKGFELFWRDKKTVKNFDYWVSYSYLDTKRDYLNFPFAITPNFAAKHTASLVMKKFVLPIKTGFNLSYNYASSRPYYNIVNSGGSYKFSDRGEVPDYHNVSFSLNYVPTVGKKDARSFVVYVLSVNNILNLKQTYGYQYSYDGVRKEAIVPPSRMFVFIGAFFSFGIDRTQDAINANL